MTTYNILLGHVNGVWKGRICQAGESLRGRLYNDGGESLIGCVGLISSGVRFCTGTDPPGENFSGAVL